jgi:hypothetical protein
MSEAHAYLAGLIDGDGSIMIIRRQKGITKGDRKRGLSFQTFVKIGGETKHLTALRQDHRIGNLWIRKRPGQRHLAEWIIAGNQARNLLQSVLPYLRLKTDQAKTALTMPQCRSRWDATPALREAQLASWQLMKRLNHRVGRGQMEGGDGSRSS